MNIRKIINHVNSQNESAKSIKILIVHSGMSVYKAHLKCLSSFFLPFVSLFLMHSLHTKKTKYKSLVNEILDLFNYETVYQTLYGKV